MAMRRYSPDQIEFLMAIVSVLVFAGVWFPLVARFVRGRGVWLELPVGAVPLLLFLAVLLIYWRRFRE
jgi:hypothetical protein